MRFSVVASAALLVAGASAWKNDTYITEVVTAYTTYCPAPTTIVYNDVTYTVTKATTLTITNCPCTITKPAIVTPVTVCNKCVEAPKVTTTTVGTVKPVASTVAPTSTVKPFTGGANGLTASGAGLAGLLALAAYIL